MDRICPLGAVVGKNLKSALGEDKDKRAGFSGFSRSVFEMPRRATRHPSEPKTTVLLKAGNLPASAGDLFRRVFWKSDFLAAEAHSFWKEVQKSEPGGLPIQTWKDWIAKRSMSVGQFYNMIHGLVGAGFIEKKESKWHLSLGFTRELEAMLKVYGSETRF